MKKLLLFLLAFPSVLWAQQLPLFTQYREYHHLINPATINSDFMLNEYNAAFGISARRQWTGLTSSPKTAVLRGEFVFNRGDERSFNFSPIVGFYLLADQTGATGLRGGVGRIAVVGSSDPRDNGISAGLTVGANQFRLDAQEIYFRDPDKLANQLYQKTYPDVGLGVFGYKSFSLSRYGAGDNEWLAYGGLSIPQVFGLDVTVATTATDNFVVKRVPHFYGVVGLYRYLPALEGSFIEVSSWVKYVKNAPIHADFNLRYQMGEYFSFGIGYSTASIVHAELNVLLGKAVGWDNNDFKIGYGFDNPFNTVFPYYGVAHEFNLTMLLDWR